MDSQNGHIPNGNGASLNPTVQTVQILCVEDNDRDFGLIRAYLDEADFPKEIALRRARSMAEVRTFFASADRSQHCDIVLLDLSLPDSQGVQTYHSLRACVPRAAVAILSGNNDHDLALGLVQIGAQDFIPKDSLSPDLLMRCITYAIKRQEYRIELENLTERLRETSEELQATQRYLVQAEKLESLGRMASSVAHEVKNPLGVVQMGLDFLKDNLVQPDGNVRLTLTLMQEAVGRADRIIHDMLDFSHQEPASMEACPLNDLVQCIERMLKHECNQRNIALRTELHTPSPVSRCNRNGIEQVLINLVTNAIQAMGKGGIVTVRTRRTRIATVPHDDGARDMKGLRTGDDVAVIEVQDRGPGIPSGIMDRIFDPFFTTKPTGEGTGLGLSICKRVVELHGGQLLVANVPEPRGLLVSVTLKAENNSPTPAYGAAEPIARPA